MYTSNVYFILISFFVLIWRVNTHKQQNNNNGRYNKMNTDLFAIRDIRAIEQIEDDQDDE